MPADASHFAETLRKLPIEFRWGSPDEGNLSRSFDEVMKEVEQERDRVEKGEEKKNKTTERGDRTYNRDLTTMSRFTKELMKVSWKPKVGKEPVLDFTAFTASVPDDPNDPDRMPWTEENLLTAFHSPIYVGGGKCGKRLKADPNGTIWHDAAYWVPLLLTYAFLTREEACGIECEDGLITARIVLVATCV